MCSRFGLLGRVQKAESGAAVGVHHRVQVDLAHPFEPPHVEGIGAQQLAGTAALPMAFAETRIGLLNLGHLFSAQLDRLLSHLLFELEQALVLAAQAVLEQDVLHRRRAD